MQSILERLLLGAALLLIAFFAGLQIGLEEAQKSEAKLQVAVLKKQATVAERVVTQYVDRLKIVREKSADIIKEVPVYVPDSSFLPGGFRLFHDAAAHGEQPDASGAADAAPVAAQDVAATVAGNYAACHENAEQLIALQEWVRRQSLD